METKDWKDPDGYTPGERLDMALAQGNPVLFFTTKEDETEMKAYEVFTHGIKAFIGRFAHMAEVDNATPPFMEELRKIVYGYDELMDHGGPRDTCKRVEDGDEEALEKEIELINEVLRDKDEKTFGFFFLGEPTSYGGRIASGFRGKHSEIIGAMGNWFRQRPAHFVEFMRHLDRISDDVKRKVVEQGDMGEVIKTMTAALKDSLSRHFDILNDDEKGS